MSAQGSQRAQMFNGSVRFYDLAHSKRFRRSTERECVQTLHVQEMK